MRTGLRLLALVGLLLPTFLLGQTDPPPDDSTHELQLLLQPQELVDGVPHAFIFILTNVGDRDLRIPSPDVNCDAPTPNGAIRLQDVWTPPARHEGLGSGESSCVLPGGPLHPDRTPFVQRAKAWTLLEPGKSIYFKVRSDFEEGSRPGTYQFSGTYDPPSLSKELLRQLADTGINVPRKKVRSPVLEYRK